MASTTTSTRSTESQALPGSVRLRPVPPPSLRTAPASRWDRFVFWLTAPDALGAAPPAHTLPAVREAFRAELADLHSEAGWRLADRVNQARTLREFWHLRAEVYRIVALQHSQVEAARRVERLDRHFGSRRRMTRPSAR